MHSLIHRSIIQSHGGLTIEVQCFCSLSSICPTCSRTQATDIFQSKHLDEVTGGKYWNLFDHFVVIDCRYKYEFNGGHINGAISVQDSKLLELLFSANICTNKRIAWIFHCEYSQKRGPRATSFIRKLDRTYNKFSYPNTCFPHCYVLNGGCTHYFERDINECTYVSMFDERFYADMMEHGKCDKALWANQCFTEENFV